MLTPLQSQEVAGTDWLKPFLQDFKTRFIALLPGAFRSFPPALALSILDPKLTFSESETQQSVQSGTAVIKADGSPLSPYDLKRLQVIVQFSLLYSCAFERGSSLMSNVV